MLAQRLQVAHLEARILERGDHARDWHEFAVGKHVAVDERGRFRALLRIIGTQRDRVVQQPSLGAQQREQVVCVPREVIRSDVLGHADARDRVERPVVDFAVVLDSDLDQISDAGIGHAFAGILGLRDRQRHTDDTGSIGARDVQRERAPTAPDVEYPRAGTHPEFARDQIALGELGRAQLASIAHVGLGLVPVRARVRHRLA